MIVALHTESLGNNEIFNLESKFNRDNCLYPFHVLKMELEQLGIQICTSDIARGKQSVNLYIDHRKGRVYSKKDILVLLETPNIVPDNAKIKEMELARAVFSWNVELLGGVFKKINFPNIVKYNRMAEFDNRSKNSVMICSNKAAKNCGTKLELYSERQKIIKWYESNANDCFELYGPGWDTDFASTAIIPRILNKSRKLIGLKNKLSVYKGLARSKLDVYSDARFVYCLENVAGANGYVTEKIFDCLRYGSVPVYIGANDGGIIPKDIYVDYSDFGDINELNSYLMNIGHKEWDRFRSYGEEWVKNYGENEFGYINFVRTLVSEIQTIKQC